jgi:hypothetical protein
VLGEARAAGEVGELELAYRKLMSVNNFLQAVEDETLVRRREGHDPFGELWEEALDVETELKEFAGQHIGKLETSLRNWGVELLGVSDAARDEVWCWWTYTGGLPGTRTRELAIWMAERGHGTGREKLKSGWWWNGSAIQVDLLIHGASWMREVLIAVNDAAVISSPVVAEDDDVVAYMLDLWERRGQGPYTDIELLHDAARRLAMAGRTYTFDHAGRTRRPG